MRSNYEKKIAQEHIRITDLGTLTGREHQVANYLIKGFQNKEIATFLNITSKTVEFHCSKIFKKLSVKDRYELQSKYFMD